MRFLLAIACLLSNTGLLRAQFVCFSDSATIYEFKGTYIPPIIGEASFNYGPYRIVVGGKFLDVKNPEGEAVYNCDMEIVDYQSDKTYVLPLSYFPPFVDYQFAGVNYCYTLDRDTAYIMGGFGYDLAEGYETTFPTLTYFPVKTLIDSVTQHRDYLSLFKVVENDRRLAITGGNMVRIGPYFLIYNGKEIRPIKEEFSDCLTVNEWDFQGQLRKFTLKMTDGYPELSEYQICNTSKVFYQCMPDNWGVKPRKLGEVERNE